MKRLSKYLSAFLSVLLLCGVVCPCNAAELSTHAVVNEKPIRVFFPEQFGFAQMDDNGKASGYTYEYLMKIAQRTGWKYEFVVYDSTNEQLSAGLESTKNGELDLANIVYSEALAQEYDIGTVPCGEANFTLITPEDNDAINERTLYTMPKLTVALNEKAQQQNALLDAFCKEKGLAYDIVYAQDNKGCQELIEAGKADFMISKDVINIKGFKSVVEFATQPFYFATWKGNAELVRQIDAVIREINSADPYFRVGLHEKYFSKESDRKISLTAEEAAFIQQTPTVRTVILTDRAPIQDYNAQDKMFHGIIIDLLKELSAQSGLSFEFIKAKSVAQAQQLLAEGKADIIAGIPYYYPTADLLNVLLTSPVFSMPVVRITSNTDQVKHPGLLVSSSIKMFDGQDNIKYVEDIGEIFSLLDKGEYKTAYVNGYLAQHYLEEHTMVNLTLTPTPYSNYDLCIGVSRSVDLRLISILEQAISGLSQSAVEDIVYQNTAHTRDVTLMDVVRKDPLGIMIPVVLVCAVIITLLLLLFLRTRQVNKMISQEKSRYQEISDTDRLTRTLNNEAFKQHVTGYLSQSDSALQGFLLICDIDDFKNINDTYGHLVGDEVLGRLGRLLQQLFSEDNVVGRLGGDEFMVFMKDMADRESAEKRCAALLEKCRTVSDRCEITLSIGLTSFKGRATYDELFRAADKALYIVKSRGKNGFFWSGK